MWTRFNRARVYLFSEGHRYSWVESRSAALWARRLLSTTTARAAYTPVPATAASVSTSAPPSTSCRISASPSQQSFDAAATAKSSSRDDNSDNASASIVHRIRCGCCSSFIRWTVCRTYYLQREFMRIRIDEGSDEFKSLSVKNKLHWGGWHDLKRSNSDQIVLWIVVEFVLQRVLSTWIGALSWGGFRIHRSWVKSR